VESLVTSPSTKVRKKVPSVLTWPVRRLVLARLTSRSLYLQFTSRLGSSVFARC
jgi:hypothetical protein